MSAVDSRRSSLVTGNRTSSPGRAITDAADRGAVSRPSSFRQVLRAYVDLCKPRIIELLLITAVPVLFLADRGLPSLLDAAVVVVGGALAAGSANALNCYIDRDIDQVMRRTRGRPLARHSVSPRAALIFGTVLGIVSVGLFAAIANLLAAVLTLGAILYYVVVYTMLLKRRTSQSTLWGGICGAAPVLIAWAAVRGSLSWPAFLLFLVVFFWQPTHFWALAVKFKDDYKSVNIPMLPVVAPLRRVLSESLADSWLMVAASVAVWPLAAGPLYGVSAVVLGGAFLAEVHRLHLRVVRGEQVQTIRLFHESNIYLTLLFAALAADSLIR
ncbi:MAG TPA: heme o synthase [Streptosporangiaceae bacterium]|nr:heme o synthase [Streptosporangiaceae bacterium]